MTTTMPDPAAPAVEEGGAFPTGLAARYAVGNLGSASVYALFNTALPLYLESYGVPPEWIGPLANERSFIGAFVQPLVGRVSDRTRTPLGRRRPFFLVGVPLMALSLVLLAVHPPFWLMLTLMTIGSFFLAVASDPYVALLADLFPPLQRGRVGGFLGLTSALGAIGITLLATFLWKDHEALVFGLTIAILVVTFAFTFLTVREPPLPARAPPRPAGRLDPGAYVRGLLQYPEAAKLVLAATFFWIGSGGATPYVTLFGRHALGADGGQVFLLPLAFVACNAVFALPAGILADRLGKKTVLTAGLLIYGLGALVGSQSANLWQAVIALAVAGLGNAGTATTLNPLLTDLIPRSRTAEFMGLGSSIWSLVQPLGSLLAGIVVGLAANSAGLDAAYRWAFIFAGVLIILAAGLLQWVRPARAVTT
jgi:maltose/moltooligosaccharide transporter